MKAKKSIVSVIIISVIIVTVGSVLVHNRTSNEGQTSVRTNPSKVEPAMKEAGVTPDTGMMFIGRFPGKVSYDTEKEYYFLELRGARLPFKTSPKQALEVELEAHGRDDLEKNRSLLYGMIGPQVTHATLLVNPDEEDDVMPAVTDLSRYIKIAASSKFAGIAYTKSGGKLERSAIRGPQIQSFEKEASTVTPLILIKGPKSGARSTKVRVLDDGKFVVEGETYANVTRAADFVGISLIKMLCGSPDCPDVAACATGGDCGCGSRRR